MQNIVKRFSLSRQQRLLLDSLFLGVVGGLSAQLFTWILKLSNNVFMQKLAGYIPPGLPEEGGVLKETIGAAVPAPVR